MKNPFYVELENNHHYILVNEETGRAYYTPAQDDANSLAYKLNQQNKTISDLTGQLLNQSSKKR